MKKIILLALVCMGSASVLAVEQSRINFIAQTQGHNKLGEAVTIKMWRATNLLSPAAFDLLKKPYKTIELKPGKKVTVVVPEGPYWTVASGEVTGRSDIGGLLAHGFKIRKGGVTYNIKVEAQRAGVFGLGRKIAFTSGELDITESKQSE